MKRYLELTRSPWYSYLFALPLLALYELTALLANLGERRSVINGADALVQSFLNGVGLPGWLAGWVAVAVIAGIVVYRKDAAHRKGRLETRFFLPMLAESAAYALVLGSVVAILTSLLFPGVGYLQIGNGSVSWGQKLATSLGAGLYEELVFRVLLAGGVTWGLLRAGWKRGTAAAAAVLVSSVIFSLFHYLPPFGETFRPDTFSFRLVAGVVLWGLFWLRGFAVAAWTHALYDVFLLVVGRP